MSLIEYNKQVALIEEMQEVGFNLVTCGHCGNPFIHRTKVELEFITCPDCDTEQELCDAPDLFYRGDNYE